VTKTLDLSPQTVNIVVRAGDVRSFRLRTSNADLWDALTNEGAGGTWLSHVRKKESSELVAFELELIEEADALFVVIPTETSSVFAGSSARLWLGVYDIQGLISGAPVTLVEGEFRIKRDVTR
jgi:hypothetical protein